MNAGEYHMWNVFVLLSTNHHKHYSSMWRSFCYQNGTITRTGIPSIESPMLAVASMIRMPNAMALMPLYSCLSLPSSSAVWYHRQLHRPKSKTTTEPKHVICRRRKGNTSHACWSALTLGFDSYTDTYKQFWKCKRSLLRCLFRGD